MLASLFTSFNMETRILVTLTMRRYLIDDWFVNKYYGSWEAQLWFLARHTWHITVKYVFKITNSIKFKSIYFKWIMDSLFLFYYYLLKVQCRLLNSGRTGRTSSISAQKSNPGLHCLPLVVYSKFGDLFNFGLFILLSLIQLYLQFYSFLLESVMIIIFKFL